jgi:hypothetical protein
MRMRVIEEKRGNPDSKINGLKRRHKKRKKNRF